MLKALIHLLVAAVVINATGRPSAAAAGTTIVASPGAKALISSGWPAGVATIVNDPARTVGWNNWFTESPNDLNRYAFEINTMDDLNRLVKKLAETKSKQKLLRLSYAKKPNRLSWSNVIREDLKIPVIFSIGDQRFLDAWHKQNTNSVGGIKLKEFMVAVPPTLTIFVQHQRVDLDLLSVPAGIEVIADSIPSYSERPNGISEEKRRKKVATAAAIHAARLTGSEKKVFQRIQQFIQKYQSENPKSEEPNSANPKSVEPNTKENKIGKPVTNGKSP